MKKLPWFLGVVCVLLLMNQADAGMIFGDQFDDASHMSVGDWDEGTPVTFSIVSSPGGKAGKSYMASWDGTAATSATDCAHMKNDLGGVAPTAGTATYLWHFRYSGAQEEAYHAPGFVTNSTTTANNMLLYQLKQAEASAYSPGSGFVATGVDCLDDSWYSVAFVVDLDNVATDTKVYLAQGLSLGTTDLVATIKTQSTDIPYWDFITYAATSAGLGYDMYIDDLTVNSGEDLTFVPEPSILCLLAMSVFPVLLLIRRDR